MPRACIPTSGHGTEMEIVNAWLPENANPVLRRFLEASTFVVREREEQSTFALPMTTRRATPIGSETPDRTG